MSEKVQLDMLVNAKAMLVSLREINAKMTNIYTNTLRMNNAGATGATKHGSAIRGLALRFVGYNLVLNQVMAAQQKLYQYVTEGVTKFREFETRLAEVSTIMTDDWEVAITGMKAGIEGLALSFGQNTSDLTKGLYDIMSAAFSAEDAMSLLNTATKASIAGLSEVRTAVDIFTTVLNTYGMSAYEATAVSDTLFQSVVRGKFQFEELESALGYVVPIAAQAGIEFKELMAALSTTTRHGLHLDMASRGLAMGLQNIIKPSEGARKAAEKYQIELSGLALRIKGIAGVFGEMNTKTKEYGKIVLNELIPNIRALRVAMVLAGEEGMEGLLDDMDMLSVSAGRTEQALSKIQDTSQFVSNQITQQWEKTQREVGKSWDELALNAQRALTTIAEDWKSFIPIIGPIFTAMDYERDKKALDKMREAQKKYLGEELISRPETVDIEKELQKVANDTTLSFQEQYEQMAALKQQRDTSKAVEYWDATDRETRSATEHMKAYLDLQKEMGQVSARMGVAVREQDSEKVKELSDYLLGLNTISAQLGDTFNEVFGEPVLGGVRELENLRLALDELSFDIVRLRDELEKPIQFGWGGFQEQFEAEKGIVGGLKGTLNYQMQVLLAEQELADVRHDIKSGLEDETYSYKVLNKEMQDAVRIVREHEAAVKKDREETALMNIELRKIQIQMLELQLVGMMRRRGLTRSEQKRMKALQIEQAKIRLENLRETKEETAEMHVDYFDRKNILDDYVRDLEQNQYQLKYSYDQQIQDLQTTIDYESQLLKDRATQWDETIEKITTKEKELGTVLASILSDKDLTSAFDIIGVDILALRNNVTGLMGDIQQLTAASWPGKDQTASPDPTVLLERLKQINQLPGLPTDLSWIINSLSNYQGSFYRGTEYVHETGMAMVHKGESIGAAGNSTGTSGVVIQGDVIIDVSQIADIGDADKLAALLSVARNTRAISKTGKTKYRLR